MILADVVEPPLRQERADPTTMPLRSVLTPREWAELDAALFDGSAVLESIRDHARHVRVSPTALLFVSLVRVLAAIPPTVTLNAGGGPAALNLFVSLIGPSGAGKDRTINAAARALTVYNGPREVETPTFPLGSGEGVVGVFAPREGADGPIPGEERALFVETEVSALTVLMGRTGATLRSTLLKVYSGGDLGMTNKAERVSVEWGTYRAGLIVGAQPDRVGGILDDDGDGLPQRFLWTELVDPLREPGRAYPAADALPVTLPEFDDKGITFCDAAVDATRAADDNRLISGHTGGLNAHGHLTRLKAAAAIAALRGRAHVDADDWRRSGVLMAYSDRVRASCLAHLEGQRIAAEVEKRERHEAAEEHTLNARRETVRGKVFDSLESADTADGWVNERIIRRGLTKSQQAVLPEVLDAMTEPIDDSRPIECRPNPDPRAQGALQWRIR